MSDEYTSLHIQLKQTEESLRVLRERMTEYAQPLEIPLQLKRDEQTLLERIKILQAALQTQAPPPQERAQDWSGGFWRRWGLPLAGVIVLVAAIIFSRSWNAEPPPAPTDTPPPTPVSTDAGDADAGDVDDPDNADEEASHWYYGVQVVEAGTGATVPIAGAKVTILPGSGASIDDYTGNDGFVRLSVPERLQGSPAKLHVEAAGYETSRQDVDLDADIRNYVELVPVE